MSLWKRKIYPENVGVIGDTHLPFEHKHYLDFVLDIFRRCKCGTIVHVGDLVDNHSISYHEHDPNGWSPSDEMRRSDKHLAKWIKAFPTLNLCLGNHDLLVDRKAVTMGLPRRVFKPFRDIWNLPDTWNLGFQFTFSNVLYRHGTGYSGKQAHIQAAYDARRSCVIGHTHTVGAVQYLDTADSLLFGMNVGCGIDIQKYAFDYGKDFKNKPVLGCGVVTDRGKYAQFFPLT